MAPTSDHNETEFDPHEQVTPFFNRAQLYAFSRPPSKEAIKKVQSGGSHDYLPHVYIRTLLDRYIGAGLWAARSTVHTIIEEIVDKGNKKNIAITAVVNVELDILSRIDPDKRLTYAGIGTHTMESEVSKGKGKTLANAISSAESKGIKSAAQNLGKAFGFDLTNSLDRSVLPPSLAEYARMLTETHKNRAAAAGQPRLTHEEGSAEGVQIQTPEEHGEKKPMAQARRPERKEPEKQQAADASAEQSDNNAAKSRKAPTDKKPASSSKSDNASESGSDDASAEEKQDDKNMAASGKSDEFVPWELGMDPGNDVQNWIACLRTMQRRIDQMTSDKEIANFLRRHKERVNGLPQIPATEDTPARDFRARFRKIVVARYETLGLEVPSQFQEPSA